MKKFDKYGRELADDSVVEIPLRFRRGYSERDAIRRMIGEELSRVADQRGFETLEESDDFDVGEDDALPVSEHELSDMQEDSSFTMLLDKKEKKEDSDGAVNVDRKKESDNGNGQDGESGVDGRTAGDGSERGDDVGEESKSSDRGRGRRGGSRGVAAESGSARSSGK